jgi:hypothetical protein
MRPPTSLLARVLLGVGTFLPVLGILSSAYFFLGSSDRQFLEGTPSSALWFNVTWGLLFFGGFIAFGIAVFYLFLVFRSDLVESERRFWVMGLLFFLPVTGPIFWYRVIWKQQSIAEATKRA